jgi:hypothetical protein
MAEEENCHPADSKYAQARATFFIAEAVSALPFVELTKAIDHLGGAMPNTGLIEEELEELNTTMKRIAQALENLVEHKKKKKKT